MKLIFGQEQIEFEKTPSAEDVITKINELHAEDYYFSHFIADGIEIYEDHEDYLNVNLGRVKKLEVVAKIEKEFINDVLISAEDYLKRAKAELVALDEDFSNGPTTETWASFDMLLEGAGWLNDMLSVVGGSNTRPANWEAYAELSVGMQGELAKLGEAVEKEDHVRIGNILRNGLILNFDALEMEIGTTIDSQGVRVGLS